MARWDVQVGRSANVLPSMGVSENGLPRHSGKVSSFSPERIAILGVYGYTSFSDITHILFVVYFLYFCSTVFPLQKKNKTSFTGLTTHFAACIENHK